MVEQRSVDRARYSRYRAMRYERRYGVGIGDPERVTQSHGEAE